MTATMMEPTGRQLPDPSEDDLDALVESRLASAVDPAEYRRAWEFAYRATGDRLESIWIADMLVQGGSTAADWKVEDDPDGGFGAVRWRNVHDPRIVVYPPEGGAGSATPTPWGDPNVEFAQPSLQGMGTPVPTPRVGDKSVAYAAEDWSEEKAPRAEGGKRWRNKKTGKVTYTDPTNGGREAGAGTATALADRSGLGQGPLSAAASVPATSEAMADSFALAIDAARRGDQEEIKATLRGPLKAAVSVLGQVKASEIISQTTAKMRAAAADFAGGAWKLRVSEFVASRAVEYATDTVFAMCLNTLGGDSLGPVTPTMAASVLTSSVVAAAVVKVKRKLAERMGQAPAEQHAKDDGELYVAATAVEKYLGKVAAILGVEPPDDVEDQLALALRHDAPDGARHYIRLPEAEDSIALALRYLRAGGTGDAVDAVAWALENPRLLDDQPDVAVEDDRVEPAIQDDRDVHRDILAAQQYAAETPSCQYMAGTVVRDAGRIRDIRVLGQGDSMPRRGPIEMLILDRRGGEERTYVIPADPMPPRGSWAERQSLHRAIASRQATQYAAERGIPLPPVEDSYGRQVLRAQKASAQRYEAAPPAAPAQPSPVRDLQKMCDAISKLATAVANQEPPVIHIPPPDTSKLDVFSDVLEKMAELAMRQPAAPVVHVVQAPAAPRTVVKSTTIERDTDGNMLSAKTIEGELPSPEE